LTFVEIEQLNLKEFKTSLSFKGGVVKVKPFKINNKDIVINVDGSHTFDSKLNYKATLDVPSKYLGNEVNNLISRINDSSLENLTIPVTTNIGGIYTNPQITTDLTSGVKQLTSKLIEIEKQKLVNKGKNKAQDIIGGLLGRNQTETDTLKKDSATNSSNRQKAKDILGGLLGNETPKDSTTIKKDSLPVKTEREVVKEKAKDILGGLLGKKKKDTVN